MTLLAADRPYEASSQHAGIVWISGTVAAEELVSIGATNFGDQVDSALARLADKLDDANSCVQCLLQVTCYVVDPTQVSVMNDVYKQRIPAPRPPRTTVGVQLRAGVLFEVDATAKECDHK